MKLKERGYFKLPVYDYNDEGELTLIETKLGHFSWVFRRNLKQITGQEMHEWGEKFLRKKTVKDDKGNDVEVEDTDSQSEAVLELVFAALVAHDMENDIDYTYYNIYNVENWLYAVAVKEPKVVPEIIATYHKSIEDIVEKLKGRASQIK